MPTKTFIFLFIYLLFNLHVFSQSEPIQSNLTLSTSLRYQLDRKMKFKHYPTSNLFENFDIHVLTALEIGYQRKKFVAQLSLSIYGGKDTLTRLTSRGQPDYHFTPPPAYTKTTDYWSYISNYNYLATRLSVGRRFFSESLFNLDLGGYVSIDTRINLDGRNYVHITTSETISYTDPSPSNKTETISYDEFALNHFSRCFVHFGLRIAPQFVVKDRLVFGLESNLKLQLGNGRRQIAYKPSYYEELTFHDLLAFDYAIRVGYILRPRIKKYEK